MKISVHNFMNRFIGLAMALFITACTVNLSESPSNPDGNSGPLNIRTITQTPSNTLVMDDFEKTNAGKSFNIEYTNTPNGYGVLLKSGKDNRIEYTSDSQIPYEGTMEWLVKVDRGYFYNNNSFSFRNDTARLFDMGEADDWHPGMSWLSVFSNGCIGFTITTSDGGTKPNQGITVYNTSFRFNEWHVVSVSYGSQGQWIAVDGVVCASNTANTQYIGLKGYNYKPVIGENVSRFWANNRYDTGFEGIVDAFRTSKNQKDFQLVNYLKPGSICKVFDTFDNKTLGVPSNIEYVTTPGGFGVSFKANRENRIEYNSDSQIPYEGTMEWLVKLNRGYRYNNNAFSFLNDSARLFDMGEADGWLPGMSWLTVLSNGTIGWTITTEIGGRKPNQNLTAYKTPFRFNEWHVVSISYGSKGQTIAIDGDVYATSTMNTQWIGIKTVPYKPVIGENISRSWANNRYDTGFEGVIETFRTSSLQKDFGLHSIIMPSLVSLRTTNLNYFQSGKNITNSLESTFYIEVEDKYARLKSVRGVFTGDTGSKNINFTWDAVKKRYTGTVGFILNQDSGVWKLSAIELTDTVDHVRRYSPQNGEGVYSVLEEGKEICTAIPMAKIYCPRVEPITNAKNAYAGYCISFVEDTARGLYMSGYSSYYEGFQANSNTFCLIKKDVDDVTIAGTRVGYIWNNEHYWNYNLDGNRTNFSRVPLDNINKLVLKDPADYFGAIKQDGSLWLKGFNDYGQLGLGYKSQYETEFHKVADDVEAVTGGDKAILLVKKDNTLWLSGLVFYNKSGLVYSNFIKIMDDVKMASVGGVNGGNQSLLVLKTDGTLWVAGSNKYGEIGLGALVAANTGFVQVMTNIRSIGATDTISVALDNENNAYFAGTLNIYDKTVSVVAKEYRKIAGNIARMTCCGENILMVDNNGKVFGYYENYFGQLGVLTSGNQVLEPAIAWRQVPVD